MALQSSGTIGLGNIQTVFGGTNPIAISEYYSGGSFVAAGTAGIPTTGQIGLSNFYGKGPTVTDSNIAAFNATNTNITIDGTTLFTGDDDDSSYSFTTSTIGWTFFVGGAQVTTLTVSSNAFFDFTAGSVQRYNYSWADRRGYNFTYGLRRGVLRFTNRHAYFFSATDRAITDLIFEFLFYRTSSFQYIEARANSSMKYSGTAGTFDGTANFQGITLPQLTAGTSYVLRSDLNGNNWRLFSNSTVSLAPPVSSGLVGMYTPQSWRGTQWTDLSGSGNHASVTGTIARNIFFPSTWSSFISGGTAANLIFPTAILPSTYTLFYVARYVGPSRARIFSGTGGTNWLSGFWMGLSGVAFHNNWLTQSTSSLHGDNWFYATDQNNNFRTQSVNRVSGTAGTPSFARLTINGGWAGAEFSDWAVATVLVYNRTLILSEMTSVESFLANMFGI